MATKPKPKSAAQLATEKKMRDQAAAAKAARAKAATDAANKPIRDYYAKNGHIPTILANLSNQYFNTRANASVYDQLGRLVATGKMTRAEAEQHIKQGQGITNPDALRAGLDTAAQLDPQEAALARTRAQAKAALDNLIKQQQDQAGRTNTDLAGLYSVLVKNIQGNNPVLQQNFAAQQAAQANTAQAAQQNVAQNYGAADAATQAAVAGMGAGQTQAQEYGNADAKFLQGVIGANAQASQNELGIASQNALGTNTAYGNYASAQGTQEQAQVVRRLLDQINSERQDWTANDQELAGQYNDLEGTRFNKIYEGQQSLAQARAAAEAAAAERQFNHQLAYDTLGVKQDANNISRMNATTAAQKATWQHEQDLANQDLNNAKLALQRSKTASDIARNTAAVNEAQARVNKINNDIATGGSGSSGGSSGSTKKPSKGLSASRYVVDQFATQYDLPPSITQGMHQIIIDTMQGKNFRGGLLPTNPQTVAEAVKQNALRKGMGQLEIDVLTDAVYAYFGQG